MAAAPQTCSQYQQILQPWHTFLYPEILYPEVQEGSTGCSSDISRRAMMLTNVNCPLLW
jgi:hypothetical protein